MIKKFIAVLLCGLLLGACSDTSSEKVKPTKTTKPTDFVDSKTPKKPAPVEETTVEETVPTEEANTETTTETTPITDDERFTAMLSECQTYYTDASTTAGKAITVNNDPIEIQSSVDKSELAYQCFIQHTNEGPLINTVKFQKSKEAFATAAALLEQYKFGMKKYISDEDNDAYDKSVKFLIFFNGAWSDLEDKYTEEYAQ
jgi:hypothetical protein